MEELTEEGAHLLTYFSYREGFTFVGLVLQLTNSIDDYSEKYGMMGGLVQKPVTAPVVPSWSSF